MKKSPVRPYNTNIVYIRLYCIVVSTLFLFLNCSLSNDTTPIEWTMDVTAPLIHQTIMLNDQLKKAKIGAMFIDSTTDTLTLTYQDSVEDTLNIQRLLSLEPKSNSKVLQAVELQNIDPITTTLTLLPNNQPIIESSFSVSSQLSLRNISWLLFDETCKNLSLSLTNNCQAISLRNLSITIKNSDSSSIGPGFLASLAPLENKTISIPVAQKLMTSPCVIQISGIMSPAFRTLKTSLNTISIAFNLNTMVISQAQGLDSLFSFNKSYIDKIDCSDSLHIKHCDVERFQLDYQVTNRTGIAFLITAQMNHFWDQKYCQTNGFDSIGNLNGTISSSDSVLFYRGRVFNDTFMVSQTQISKTGSSTIYNTRMFTSWDDTLQASVITYNYNLLLVPKNRFITYNKNDTLFISVTPSKVNYTQLKAKALYDIQRNYTAKTFAIAYPWDSATQTSLKNKVHFYGSHADLQVRIRMANESSIDSLGITIITKDKKSTDTSSLATLDTTLHAITNSSQFLLPMSLDKLINTYPDSLTTTLSTAFPKGSNLLLNNSTDAQGKYLDTLSIAPQVKNVFFFPLLFQVVDSIRVVLKDFIIEIPVKDLRFIRKLKNLTITHGVTVNNHSPITGKLYGLATEKTYKNQLSSLAQSEIIPSIVTTEKGKHFFHAFGPHGIELTPLQDSLEQSAIYDWNAIQSIVATDSLIIRAVITVPKTALCTMTKNDYIMLMTNLRIEGIAQSDSMIIWQNALHTMKGLYK